MTENHIKNNKTRVSIGLPVYNGEKYLKEAIDSILAQTFKDFELIISDNASTDRTSQICESYVNKDVRIRYYRNEKNLGASGNFNRVFELSTGVYFKWASHDDIIAPDYIFKCVEVLDKDDLIVLCNSKVKFIDECGKFILDYNIILNKVNSPKPQDRFGDIISLHHWCFDIFGLIRSESLRKTSLIQSYPGSDRTLLAQLSLLGRFYEIPQYLFFNRDHQERSVRAIPIQLRAGWFDTSKAGQISLPKWRIFFEYFKSVNHFSLNLYERACCYVHIGNWLRRYHVRLVKELIFTIKYYYNSIICKGSNEQKTLKIM